ncbi:MAG: hypothetical protein WBA39_04155 [Rivularia sp. (in: cyanobacteria)]
MTLNLANLNLVSITQQLVEDFTHECFCTETYLDLALFKIKNQGIGISNEDKQSIFSSFQRGSNAGIIRGKKCVNLQGKKSGLIILPEAVQLLMSNYLVE